MLWKTLPYMIGIVVADYWAGSIWPFLLSATAITVTCSFFKPSRVAGWAAMLFAIGFAKRDVPLLNTLEDGVVEIVLRPGGLWQVESMTGRLAMCGGSAAE